MREQDEWVAWIDEHPWLAGFMQLGIYALCWLAVFAVIAFFAFLMGEFG